MAPITWDHVVDHAAELSSVDVEAKVDILAHVNDTIATEFFGGEDAARTKMARVYLAAHMGSIAKSRGSTSTGAVTAESAGGLSRSYSVVTTALEDLDATSYGRSYAGLVKRSAARVPFVP